MKSLETLATNPFLAALQGASRENNVQFIYDTFGRFDANNPAGIYNGELPILKAAAIDYKNAVSRAQLGERKASTQSVDDMQKRIAETGRRLYSKLEVEFGLKAGALLVFFPKGLSGISVANRGDFAIIINNWNLKAAKPPYTAALGPGWIDELAELKTEWDAAIGAQSGAKEEVGDGASDAESFLTPLAQRLWNLLLLVIQNNQPNAQNVVGNYFDTTPFEHRHNKGNDGLGRTFGTAKDITGTGLPEVHIAAKDAGGQKIWSGKTNGEGKWRTKNIAVGTYHLTFEKPGYVTQTVSHEFLDAEDTEVNVVLVAVTN